MCHTVIFTLVTSARCVTVKKKKLIFGTKQKQQAQDCLLFPFPSIGSTSSAYLTEPKWSVVCVDLTWFILKFASPCIIIQFKYCISTN